MIIQLNMTCSKVHTINEQDLLHSNLEWHAIMQIDKILRNLG